MTTATYPEVEIELPPLHRSQREIALDSHRFKVVCCGRRWGKTLLAVGGFLLPAALEGKRVWHVAPTYKQTLEAWDYLMRLVTQLPPRMVSVAVSELRIGFAGGGSIQMRTADNPNNLRGSGLDGVVVDEAATAKQEVWDLVLRPALADRQGWALFISTPNHFNWFYDLFCRGEEEGNPDWASWQRPTWDNPHIAETEINAARRDMEDADFQQEFGASFTAVGGAVFPLLSADRHIYLRPMPAGTLAQMRRKGAGADWGTTREHLANLTTGGILPSGAVWFTSSWLSDSGDARAWKDEARAQKQLKGLTFIRIDHTQTGAYDDFRAMGYETDRGLRDVEGRIGDMMGLVRRRAVFWDANDPGARESFRHFCEYHRDADGKIVEEHDDDVDGGLYLVSELVRPRSGLGVPGSHGTAQRQPPPSRSKARVA